MTTDLNPRYSFSSFVEGESNRVACSAARSVAESPGTSYNPLFIYGPTGLGKTHLLMAIGNLAKSISEEVAVEYFTLDEFLEAYQVATATGQADGFRNRFDGIGLLLLDDIQFLAHRQEVQAELLRVISACQKLGQQVVLTSDTPPTEIEEMDDRLLRKLDSGLVVDVGPLDQTMRRRILEMRAEERGADFGDDVIAAVASFEVSNVRELLGLLNRLAAFQAVSEMPVTAEAARAMLDWDVSTPEPAVSAAASPPPDLDEDPFGMTPLLIDMPESNEFEDFLADVSNTVQQQVEVWRERLAKAILRWQPEGYRTVRLENALRADEVVAPIEQVVGQFEADVKRLAELQEAMREIAPDRANDVLFFDPDRVADAEHLVQLAVRELGTLPGPSEAYSSKGFVESESNRVPVTAVGTAVAEPGKRYNPLVFVGGPGVGKTHLLHVIGHKLASLEGFSVACMSTQQFLEELQQSIDDERWDSFRARFGKLDALCLDDIQLLGGRRRAQEEFFYLFNRLLDAGKQVVLTLNVPPREIEGLDERIVSRLEGGLLASLDPPDRELRRALIIRRLEEIYGAAEADLVEYLAARPASSVRAVLGLVQRVLSAAEARGQEPDGTLARELIEGALPTRDDGGRGIRTSGVTSAPGLIHSTDKVIWRWPDPIERIIEELV